MTFPCSTVITPASPTAFLRRWTRHICLTAWGARKLATNLKKTDVVIIGMGATGGVAALPLTRAGLEVIGLEAGTWLSPNDFAPDELRNNYRGWPQLVQKANHEVPTHRRRDGAA